MAHEIKSGLKMYDKDEYHLNKRQYLLLLKFYYDAKDEYHKFDVNKLNTEEQKTVGQLVSKNYMKYSDNTNKVEFTLAGLNRAIVSPPGLTGKEQDECLRVYSPATKKRTVYRPENPSNAVPRQRSVSNPRTPGQPKKIDMVRKYLLKGQNPQQIFESMANDGVTTTVGSVKCFIKTINDEKAQSKKK